VLQGTNFFQELGKTTEIRNKPCVFLCGKVTR